MTAAEGMQMVFSILEEAAGRFQTLEGERGREILAMKVATYKEKSREKAEIILNLPAQLLPYAEVIPAELRDWIFVALGEFAEEAKKILTSEYPEAVGRLLKAADGPVAEESRLDFFIEELKKRHALLLM